MKRQEKISVITPVKNGSKYLNKCIQSVLNQSYKNLEWIIIDDHSSDNTWAILSDLVNKDNRIKIYKNRGRGIIDALNMATEITTGKYITRMDADDVMPSDKLANLVSTLNNETNSLATGHVTYIENEYLKAGYRRYADWLNLQCENQSHYQEIYKECPIASPSWLMLKQDFIRIGGFTGLDYPEDYDFAFRCLENKIKIKSTSEVVHLWRDYPERTSRNDPNYADNSFIDLKMRRFFQLHYSFNKPLTLWGAGKKGKEIAKNLIARRIDFDWVCDNPRKIGIDIHGKKLKHFSTLHSGLAIIYVTSTEDQESIHSYLKKHPDIEYYWFC